MIPLSSSLLPPAIAAAAAEALGRDPQAGERVEAFEERVADKVGRKFAVACASGTASLHMALAALQVGTQDEIVLPAFGALTAAHAVEHTRARPVFADVDPGTYTIDASAVAAALTAQTRVVVASHTFGLCADMEPLLELTRGRGLALIEDGAGALAASYRGQAAGTFGDLACFEMGPWGAVVLTDDADMSVRLHSLRGRGMEIVDGRYQCLRPGMDCPMAEVQAAVCAQLLAAWDPTADERIRLAKRYTCGLADRPSLRPQAKASGFRHMYASYVVTVEEPADRNALMSRMRGAGVETGRGGYALHDVAYYRDRYGLAPERFPEAHRLAGRALALPMHGALREAEVDRVLAALAECLDP